MPNYVGNLSLYHRSTTLSLTAVISFQKIQCPVFVTSKLKLNKSLLSLQPTEDRKTPSNVHIICI